MEADRSGARLPARLNHQSAVIFLGHFDNTAQWKRGLFASHLNTDGRQSYSSCIVQSIYMSK